MSKPRYRWWGFARAMIRDYPKLKSEYSELHRQSLSGEISGMPRGHEVGRTVEAVALCQLPEDDQKAYDAVTKAIEITRAKVNGTEQLKLIRLMYWERTTAPAKIVSAQLYISEATAKRWHGSFVRLVGICYGFKI